MPPRETTPQNTTTVVDSDDDSTESTFLRRRSSQPEAKTMMQPALAKHTRCTFHWELNGYCLVALAALYHVTPVSHRFVWHILFGLLAVDAARYYYWRGTMTGVPYTLPLVNLMAMLINPERFWAELGTLAMASHDGLCANTMVGNAMIFCTDPALCRQVMTAEGTYSIYAHPNAIWLFDPKNLIYLQADVHKKVRAVLTPALFSETALKQYQRAQEHVCRQALQGHAQQPDVAFDAMASFRSLGAMSSQESFLGPYLDQEMRASLEEDILVFTMGFLSFPFPYAGGLRKALLAKDRIERLVFELVPQARAYILEGHKPRCLMEHWCQAIVETAKERGCEPTEVHGCTDDDISRCVLDFLFAAQDATNSGLVYTLDLMHAYPDIFEKCHQEVVQACGPTGPVSGVDLPYVSKVANQLLHHKPPVPMVPHLAQQDNELAGYKIKKGTVVIPSITYSARSTGHALEFLPERSDPDTQFFQTIVFGAGQHKCPGRRYAESLLSTFLAVLAQQYTVHRVGQRPGPDDFIFFPTLFPKDCHFIVKKRQV